MRIGIDVSQLAYENTGVANYLENLVQNMILLDKKNHYTLFYSSLRVKLKTENLKLGGTSNVTIKKFRIPPTILDFMWNKLHMMPIENFIGDVDIFITSDWTEPPTKHAKKATILYDLIIYKYPKESHNQTEFNPLKLIISPNIVASQKRKLKWVKEESDKILCISESTKKDAAQILAIEPNRLAVISAGI